MIMGRALREALLQACRVRLKDVFCRVVPGAEGQRRGRGHALRAARQAPAHVHHAAQARSLFLPYSTLTLIPNPNPLCSACRL